MMPKDEHSAAVHPRRPLTGFRRLTPAHLAATQAAEAFTGLPEGVTHPSQLLAMVKTAAPYLGIAPRLVYALDRLFRYTQPQDWEPGAQPLVWPSAAQQQHELGLSATQVRAINRTLIEHRLIALKDSPNGKRYGHRDASGRIIEAYGIDLSPLAVRYQEFLAAAEADRAERAAIAKLRRRATIARKGILQILETAQEHGLDQPSAGFDLEEVKEATRTITTEIRNAQTVAFLEAGVLALERRQQEALNWLRTQLKPTETAPKGAKSRCHIIPTDPESHPEQDTVEARQTCKPQLDPAGACQPTQAPGPDAQADPPLRITPDGLVRLAPRLQPYLTCSQPQWRDIVEAAYSLRREMDISPSLWGEACMTMGREKAAIALALVSTKPPEHFRTTPGGYFYGMVAKAKTGDLHLERTIFALRQAKGAATGRPPSHKGWASAGHPGAR